MAGWPSILRGEPRSAVRLASNALRLGFTSSERNDLITRATSAPIKENATTQEAQPPRPVPCAGDASDGRDRPANAPPGGPRPAAPRRQGVRPGQRATLAGGRALRGPRHDRLRKPEAHHQTARECRRLGAVIRPRYSNDAVASHNAHVSSSRRRFIPASPVRLDGRPPPKAVGPPEIPISIGHALLHLAITA